MRRTAAVANRIWLAVIGVLVVLAGLVGLLIGTGLVTRLGVAVGLDLAGPGPQAHLFGSTATRLLSLDWVLVLVVLGAVLLGLLALVWLLAQVPRREGGKPLRLQDDPSAGLTRCEPKVINDVVEEQLIAMPGVIRATAILRGTADQPDLTARVSVDEGTDLTDLLSRIETEVGGGLATALDTRLRRLAVLVDVSAGSRSSAPEISVPSGGIARPRPS